jgi:hypothetical protein
MTQESARRFLIVLAADDRKGTVDPELGLSRIAPAYYVFKDSGADVTLASPFGGSPQTVIIGRGSSNDEQAVRRFKADRDARDDIADTLRLDQIVVEDFDSVFCLGLSGRIWSDDDLGITSLLRSFLAAGKPLALVPGKHLDISPNGAGDGLLVIGENDDSALSAARTLVIAVANMVRPSRA